MNPPYETPPDDDRGYAKTSQRAVQQTADDVSVLGDDITDLATLIRDGLPADVGRGAGAVLAYREGLDTLRRRVAVPGVRGASSVAVAVPAAEDVLEVLDRPGDEDGFKVVGSWLDAVRTEFSA